MPELSHYYYYCVAVAVAVVAAVVVVVVVVGCEEAVLEPLSLRCVMMSTESEGWSVVECSWWCYIVAVCVVAVCDSK